MPASAANVGTDIADAFKEGKFNVDFRYRYEFVDQDNIDNDANASTIRTRLVFKSAEYKDFFVTLNLDDLRTIGQGNYNSTRNGKTDYPTVADPKGTDLNLASLTWTGLDGASIVAGRQRIKRGNLRYIGNVGWRQNEQTYDAASIDYKITDKLSAFFGYVGEVKRIFGPDDAGPGQPAGSMSSDSYILDGTYAFAPLFNLTAYGYLLEFDDEPGNTANEAALSNETYGLRLTGKGDFGDNLSFNYAAEYANQKDHEDNPNDYDEDYSLLEAGLGFGVFGTTLGYEVLTGSGANGESFQTPLATLHKFNGWADQFLSTPAGGLEDMYLKASAKLLGGTFSAAYHDFSQETGSADYGSEIDFKANWKFMENYSVLVGFAMFSVDDEGLRNGPGAGPQSDVDKVWVQLGASF
jgi:hypothetical protein